MGRTQRERSFGWGQWVDGGLRAYRFKKCGQGRMQVRGPSLRRSKSLRSYGLAM